MTRIDSVAAQADRAGRYLVRFSDGTTMRLYSQTVQDFGLYTGMEMTEEAVAALREAAGQMSAKMRAVRIVAASNVSRADLEQRLVQKGESRQQAKEAVQWMEELELVDDRKTAQLVVHRCASKGYGRARAKQMLYEKKIPKELWETVLEDYPDQTDAIVTFLHSRLQGSWDQRDLKRAMDALLRRGHSYGDIRQGLQQLQLDADSFLEE
ncbi:MAG: RecX family transcriptional regulator [Oscillospiraceae bacterium]|nr:RecX family transcriptional regulator [Oscillospiraceae bacterium]